MPKRYSDILRAAKLQAQLTFYLNYLQTRHTLPVGVGTPKSPVQTVQVNSFGHIATANEFRVKSNQRNITAIGATMATRTLTTVQPTAIANRSFKPAVVKAFVPVGDGVNATSKLTGAQYKKYNGERYQLPFGASSATEREFEAHGLIRLAFIGWNPVARVYFTPEKVTA